MFNQLSVFKEEENNFIILLSNETKEKGIYVKMEKFEDLFFVNCLDFKNLELEDINEIEKTLNNLKSLINDKNKIKLLMNGFISFIDEFEEYNISIKNNNKNISFNVYKE